MKVKPESGDETISVVFFAHFGGETLRGETKERWRELCERDIVEQDPDRFIATIQELLQVLEEERRRKASRLPVLLDERPARLTCPVA
jgi:hypothetical protein